MCSGNAKARIWATHQDFADGEAKAESFCIRMKTEEQVDKFETVFKDAVKNAVSSPKKDTTDSKPPAAATAAAAPKSMADIVAAQKASTWECQGCFSSYGIYIKYLFLNLEVKNTFNF